MPEINMRREQYTADQDNCHHAGLMLERGFAKWNNDNNKYNEQKIAFYNKVSTIKSSNYYDQAYQRWQDYLFLNPSTSKSWAAKLEGRLYLGLGEASPLESAITLHHTYGVPFIPGSAIKGVLHHALLAEIINNPDAHKHQIIDTLFGREPKTTDKQDAGEAGYIIFNDAWWIPGTKPPLVKEIITVHHQEYYSGKGAKATDFDSPNPNPQIAIQGSFLFSVEGEASWAEYTIQLLKQVLESKGIGAKTASGYGYFSEIKSLQKEIETWQNAQLGIRTLTGLGRIIEATFEGKKARVKCEILDTFMQQLSNANKKRLNKNKLFQEIKVQKEGNTFKILEVIL